MTNENMIEKTNVKRKFNATMKNMNKGKMSNDTSHNGSSFHAHGGGAVTANAPLHFPSGLCTYTKWCTL